MDMTGSTPAKNPALRRAMLDAVAGTPTPAVAAVPMAANVHVPTLDELVVQAARQLAADGWRIVRCRGGIDSTWHLVGALGERLRVVQVLPPATPAASRQRDKLRLGQTAQMSTKAGSMEQWLAHIRPGGRVTFGRDVLSGGMWGRVSSLEELRDRLGLPADGERKTHQAQSDQVEA